MYGIKNFLQNTQYKKNRVITIHEVKKGIAKQAKDIIEKARNTL